MLHLTDLGVPPKVQQPKGAKKSEPARSDTGAPSHIKADVNEANQAHNEILNLDQGRQTEESSVEVKSELFQVCLCSR